MSDESSIKAPEPQPIKKKIVLKRSANSNSNVLPSCKIKVNTIEEVQNDSVLQTKSLWSPYQAEIKSFKYLTDSKGEHNDDSTIPIKKVIEIKILLDSCECQYQPGDYIQIFSPNSTEYIDSLLKRLNFNPKQYISIESIDKTTKLLNHLEICNGNSIERIFKEVLDCSGVISKKILKLLAHYSTEEEDKISIQKLESSEEYLKLIGSRTTLLDLLERFKSTQPPLDHLIDTLGALSPRDYSISSSLSHLPQQQANFVFSLVETKLSNGNVMKGHCTSWLESLGESFLSVDFSNLDIKDQQDEGSNSTVKSNRITIPYKLKSTSHFHLPDGISDNGYSNPIIMIGPGTGVAPFVGFLQHLSTLKREKPLKTWLFFGNRSEKRDYLYRNEFENWTDSGILTRLTTAFSREVTGSSGDINTINFDITCGYVQEKMKNHSEELFNWIYKENATIYICGDAKVTKTHSYKLYKMSVERSFIAVKPDGVAKGLIGEILKRYEQKGFRVVALKQLVPTKELAEKHYEEHKERPFFGELVSFITSGPVVAFVLEGKGVVAAARLMIGVTNPLLSNPGTIRGDYAIEVSKNIIHGSDSVASAEREIALWFKTEELLQ
ncbi:nucleoside diphosphate kinase [Tieghemostelium lacteum]|uniref:nucleoside-diphosphate kinase n=1 Tax=Tieghemostelium lacteum TaxID=361077 RepID=A0A152A7J0_TIELA|nr:nucleoside diphosphate kinase [Tieghemostelium lacteum]|eukprot:KYR02178.1 nucleoside diphosphate kinase [Tieghemostelium lacteum]